MTIQGLGLDNPVLAEDLDLTGPIDDEWAALLLPDVDSPPSLVNVANTNSVTSQCTNNQSEPLARNEFFGPDSRPSSDPIMLNFGGTDLSLEDHPVADVRVGQAHVYRNEEAVVVSEAGKKPDEAAKRAQNAKRSAGRANKGPHVYDHIVAERKRREQLSQRFLTLSTIVPGLKKMDKTSVLGDAITYMKHLQERVKILEEKATKKMMESVVFVRKSRANADETNLFASQNPGPDEQALPEIEARACGTQVLIRIHCENQKGLLSHLMSQVENLNLTIVNTNITTFECLALDITIVTETGKEFSLTTKEVVKRIRAALDNLF
ncbi:Transcription factor bHLH25 [Striga hermonthica]|uniref:Transcription factor bHLH25 n=1 Tax=Striga hermonthica TaxID=68872 RepID=A0A9N7R6I1_STRHE|nr:Transcription factor bHLH25 [Striga hermonthica]